MKFKPKMCPEIQTTTYFLLHCPLFQSARQSLLINIKKIDESILKKHDEFITKTPLYGDNKFDLSYNESIISSTIELIVSTETVTQFLNLCSSIFFIHLLFNFMFY